MKDFLNNYFTVAKDRPSNTKTIKYSKIVYYL